MVLETCVDLSNIAAVLLNSHIICDKASFEELTKTILLDIHNKERMRERFTPHSSFTEIYKGILTVGSSTWHHTYIHVPFPIPTLTRVLFEGEILWSVSASVHWRPSQLAPTANELHGDVRMGRPAFDINQVTVPTAGVRTRWRALGWIDPASSTCICRWNDKSCRGTVPARWKC